MCYVEPEELRLRLPAVHQLLILILKSFTIHRGTTQLYLSVWYFRFASTIAAMKGNEAVMDRHWNRSKSYFYNKQAILAVTDRPSGAHWS